MDAGPTNVAKVRARVRAGAESRSRGPERIAAGWAAGLVRSGVGSLELGRQSLELRELARAGAPGVPPPT